MLKGTIGILVPEAFNESFSTYFELFEYILANHSYIHKFNDQHSRVVKSFIDIFSTNVLKRLGPKKPSELIAFVEAALGLESEVLDKFKIKDTEKIEQNTRFLTDFLRHLVSQNKKE